MKKYIVLSLGLALFIPFISFASTTDGTVSATDRYAWSENAGWIDFGTTAGDVHITDSALTGYAYGENIGWISLNCSNTSSCADNPYKVANNSGTLSGSAWSENAGWIDFAPSTGGVDISASGVFSGYAYSENMGWINFSVDHPVTTDWRPASSRTTASTGTTGGSSTGGQVSYAALAAMLTPSASTTAYLNSLKNPLAPCPAGFVCAPMLPLVAAVRAFSKDLTVGSNSLDVKKLQLYLNAHGFAVSLGGSGSPGHETTYFGLLTQKALAKFQKANGIVPAIGYFGPKTRAYISNHP